MATVRASQRPSASEKPLHNHIPSHSLSKSLNNTPSNHHSAPPPRSSKDRPASSRRSVTPNSRTLSNNSNNNDDEGYSFISHFLCIKFCFLIYIVVYFRKMGF